MKQIKFLHFSDLHLDMPFTSLGLSNQKVLQRRQDLKEMFVKIIETAKEEAVDIVLISGDLYEHNYVSLTTIKFINEYFKSISSIKIFMIAGNHDPYLTNSYYNNFEWNENVVILTKDNQKIILEDLGICIYGLSFSNFNEKNMISNINITDMNSKLINILLLHGTCDMDFAESNYNPMASKEIAALNMDYVALGHFHNKIEDVGGFGTIFNPGSPEPLGFDEDGNHGVFIGEIQKVSSDKSELKTNFLSFNKRNYKTINIDIERLENDKAVIDKIFNSTINENEKNLFCFVLRGFTECGYKVNSAKIIQELENNFFHVKIKDNSTLAMDFDELSKEPGLIGLYVKKMLQRYEDAIDDNDKKIILNSLQLGVTALMEGKIEIYE